MYPDIQEDTRPASAGVSQNPLKESKQLVFDLELYAFILDG